MALLASAGRHPEALLAYQRTAGLIARRLGCAPSPATRELAEALRREAGQPRVR
jgi:DNA-binding SARP family transcriptional activator